MEYLLALLVILSVFLVIYPYTLYPIILRFIGPNTYDVGAISSTDGSDFSLLFCAYNEEKSLPSKINNLIDLRDKYPGMEFLAFNDGSSDATADIIKYKAPFVKLFNGPGRSGKAFGMKLLASKSSKKFLIFTDANVLLDAEAPLNLLNYYSDTDIGGVCGSLHYLGDDETSTSKTGGAYWRLEEKIKDLESASGSVMGADGSIFSIRRELYPEFPDTVLDDFTVSMSVVFSKKRLIKSRKVKAYERLVSVRGEEFSRKVRISARAYHTHIVLKDKLSSMGPFDKFKYISHKYIRWFGGAFASLAFLFSAGLTYCVSPYLFFAFTLFLLAVLIYGYRASSGVLAMIVEIYIAMIATLFGVYKAARGKTFVTWKPAESRQ